MTITRAPLSQDLVQLRGQLVDVLPILEAHPGWYGSIYFERKSSKSFTANLKQTQMTDQVGQGVVLRIYDGYTLYEQASDELAIDSIKTLASEFAGRVKATPPPAGAVARPYKPQTWKERLAPGLESEITAQLPRDPKPDTFVHFGIRYKENPNPLQTSDWFVNLGKVLDRIKALAPTVGLDAADLTYAMARESFAIEESIFLDRETRMSQTLYRLALTIITMSGADRTYLRTGGLGGLEAVKFEDSELLAILRNLKLLKGADRLNPGKYRVLFGPVLTGVLAHEAFGHSQEGDTCARGRSKAWDLHNDGTSVGNQAATILNNPAIFDNGDNSYAAWGSYFFDEEGWIAREQVLLDKGILKAPMTNLTSALRLGVPRTANGKRESWANGVYTRQTNTYFSPGDRTLKQLMNDLGDGYLALHPAGGMEDPKGMGIQVGISYLEEVKGGIPTGRLLKGPAGGDIQMTGYTPDVLDSIVGKSKIEFESDVPDSARHPFNDAGGCGKYHKEFVFAGCGGPFVLLDGVTLG